MMNEPVQQRPRVLLAHQDPEFLELLSAVSDYCDIYNWDAARTGEEVVNLLNKHRFDAAILGSRFPDITGAMMAELIKSHFPYIKGAFISSHAKGLFKSRAEELDFEIWSKAKTLANLENVCNDIYCLAMSESHSAEVVQVASCVEMPKIFKELAQFAG